MFKNIFESIEGINIYSIVSLLIFFIFFVVITLWMIKADKRHIDEMSRKPLETNESNKNSFTV